MQKEESFDRRFSFLTFLFIILVSDSLKNDNRNGRVCDGDSYLLRLNGKLGHKCDSMLQGKELIGGK